MPLLALGILRYISATSNIIHDCDEVFNYWEPVHFLLYKTGFQTWEYSSEFALRSYLYLIFHNLVGLPASLLFGEEKVRVFYAVRFFLGLLSVVADAVLVVALSRKYGNRIASYALATLCLTSGCFFASTSFLPSSFSMYAMSLASGLFLLEKHGLAVSVATVGVILGWPFSVLAFLPVTIYSLSRNFKKVFLSGALTSLVLLALSLLVDHQYYGRWVSSVFNLLLYNIAGGGESHLYGTEGPLFYLWNGFNNFNLCFVLALLFPPHKEERFLYPVYPLICVAASAVIESFPSLFESEYKTTLKDLAANVAKFVRPIVLSVILGSVLCIGSEWHRFPSSFFVPEFVGEVRWIDDGFDGLLPMPFNSTLGGTSAAPSYFNNKNKASEEQYLRDLDACTFLVELQLSRPYPTRGNDLSKWEVIAALPYLDRELSPSFYRSFFIPHLWHEKNVFGMYKLLKRIGR
ncbi:hypothetical protein MLD38_000603 [Melastoma candidum]|uniref:Uncharacterized protein n=1 Tax=Melastoma candidum TaxID=119954 RepID=A0ACB9SA54_9MYRT|nr:hypothetical protein MLD38_000603 [Melastoma candidum]